MHQVSPPLVLHTSYLLWSRCDRCMYVFSPQPQAAAPVTTSPSYKLLDLSGKVIETSMAAGLIITSGPAWNKYICRPCKPPFMAQTSKSFHFWLQQRALLQKSNIALWRVLWRATTSRSLKFTRNSMVCIQSFIRTVNKYHSLWC